MIVPDLALAGCGSATQNGDTVTTPSLVPAPASLVLTGGAPCDLNAATAITGDVDAAATLRDLVHTRTGITLRDPDGDAPTAPTVPAITLSIAGVGDDARAPESYDLTSTAEGIRVDGADAAGLFYGIQTLVQLITAKGDGWQVPAVTIRDAPRFAYRGVMLDVARHFHPVETVHAYIDRAASLKFNALHLHLSDDQGWRLEITSRPLLTQKASATAVGGDAGGFYTQQEYRDLVAYAAARHMIMVPEIDLPGHTHAVSLAYPELSEEPVLSDHIREVARVYGGDLPRNGVPYDGMAVGFSSLKIHDEATYAFLTDVLAEVATLTPGPYLHLGGDEALGTAPEDFALFIERTSALVAATGKTPIAWHEAGVIGERLAPGTIGQYWGYRTPTEGMDEKTRGFVAADGSVILSPCDAIYLDMKDAENAPFGLTWAGVVPARQSYEWEPAALIDGVGEEAILGVEAPLWTETVADLNAIDAMAFPRIASAAEAGWSPALGTTPERQWESFAERVVGLSALWDAAGIAYRRIEGFDWPQEEGTAP